MSTKKIATFAISASLILSGCGSLPTYVAYDGGRKGENLESIIRGKNDKETFLPGHKKLIHIFCVNGKSTEASSLSTAAYRYPFEAAVMPGRTYVGALFSQGRSFSLASLWLDAAEGKTYQIDNYVLGGKVIFSVLDSESGIVVGGLTNQDPESHWAKGNCDAELEHAKRRLSTPLYLYAPTPM